MIRRFAYFILLFSLLLNLALAQEPSVTQIVKALQSSVPSEKREALEQAGNIVYSLQDKEEAARIRNELFKLVDDESLQEDRWMVAATLESYLSREDSDTSSFLNAMPLLEHSDEQVRRFIWMGFRQQASQPHLTPEIKDQLLAMVNHTDKNIAMEAMSWAIEASNVPNADASERDFAHKVLSEFIRQQESPDPDISNLSVYGILANFDRIPEVAIKSISDHLADNHAATRSLVLDFLEQNSYRDERLHALAPQVLERFEARPEDPDFPLVADAELGPAAGPPMSETFRLARILVLMDADTPSVTDFLMSMVSSPQLQGRLFELAKIQGKPGRPLLSAILEETGLQPWTEGLSTLSAVGLSKDHVPQLLTLLEKNLKELASQPDDFKITYRSAGQIIVLANSEQVELERTQAVLRSYFKAEARSPRVAALYAAAKLFPGSELAKEAGECLAETDWTELYSNEDYLVLAAYQLREQSLLRDFEVQLQDGNCGPLLAWILSPDKPSSTQPRFVKEFERGEVQIGPDGDVGVQMMALQLRWLEANPHESARPGLEILAKSTESELAQLAKRALAKFNGASSPHP